MIKHECFVGSIIHEKNWSSRLIFQILNIVTAAWSWILSSAHQTISHVLNLASSICFKYPRHLDLISQWYSLVSIWMFLSQISKIQIINIHFAL